jgi:hypothetical protein
MMWRSFGDPAPEPAPPEEVAPGLWRWEVMPGAWQWTAMVDGVSLVFTTGDPGTVASVRRYIPRPGWLGIELLNAAGERVWWQEVATPGWW